ncbi:MAG: DUF4833 domain-containing protein [Bacteroidaceae bacterium]|nr:DUF4833 domain-containing protein [Bacteroidaceae bacterium]
MSFSSFQLFRFPLLVVALLLSTTVSRAADSEALLFQFYRSTNRNYLCYDVRQTNGQLDVQKPIHVYWIRAEEDGAQKELTFIQRKLAFGYKVVSHKDNEATIHLTAYKKLLIRICQQNGKWVALTTINGQEARLTRLFVQMKSPNSLNVEYVDIFGLSTSTNAEVTERIKQ